jgi:hypothetical protein
MKNKGKEGQKKAFSKGKLFHNVSLHDFEKEKMTENIYLRLDDDGDGVDCSSVAFAPNQLNKRPIGVACNERFSTAFAALFCIPGVRAVAWAIITKFHDTIIEN